MKTGLITGFLMMLILSQISFSQKASESDLSHQGKLILGPRLALGNVYGASIGFGGQVEYGLQDNFLDLGEDIPTWLGIGGSVAFSRYSEDFFLFSEGGEYTYTNIVILGTGFFHANIVKDAPLDTYLMLSFGVNLGSVSYDGTTLGTTTPSIGSLAYGTGAGARYYFSPNAALVGEVGVGIGLLRLGLDLKL